MLQKLFFLVSLLGLDHAGWYTNDNGYTTGLVIAAVIALVACVLFYYAWGKVRALTMGHYIITILVSMVVTLVTVYFTARHMLLAYVAEAGLTEINPSILSQIKHGTFDMWLFAINSAIWCAVLYFLFSCILKNWSTHYNLPFGNRKRISKTVIKK